MRRGVIVTFALGMVILSGLFLFGGSMVDKILLKNRYFQLKEFTEKAALGAANYYNKTEDSELAQTKTLVLMQTNPLYESVQNEIEFLWDDDTAVTVCIHHTQFQPFWMRMFGVDAVDIYDVNSTARLSVSEEPVSQKTKALLPIAINERNVEIGDDLSLEYQRLECSDVKCCDFDAGFTASGSFGGYSGGFDFQMGCSGFSMGGSGSFCNFGGGFGGSINFGSDGCTQGFPWFPSMTFSSSMSWQADDENAFYGIDLEAGGTLPNGVSHNAHWKQMIAGTMATPEATYHADINLLKMMSAQRFLCADVGDSSETAQLQQAVNAFKKAVGTTFDVAMVNDKAEISGFVTVRLDGIDAKNGQNGYLKINAKVVENQNNKEVKLVD